LHIDFFSEEDLNNLINALRPPASPHGSHSEAEMAEHAAVGESAETATNVASVSDEPKKDEMEDDLYSIKNFSV